MINIVYTAHNLITNQQVECIRVFDVDNKFDATIMLLAFIDKMNVQYDGYWKYTTELKIASRKSIITRG